MPVFKRRYRSGRVVWGFKFDAPGSTRENRRQITGSGFASRREAEMAEARRRMEEEQRYRASLAGPGRDVPTTLGGLIEEYLKEHGGRRLSMKTEARYRELVGYLSPDLLAMRLDEVTPLHLAREWSRLLESGGRVRGTGQSRPLSAKTVRHIAGVVSAAFGRAVRWGLVGSNPVASSDPPVPERHVAVALSDEQIARLLDAAGGLSSPWCLRALLELALATGARRGELLALRWSDIDGGSVIISRSLCQVGSALEFKATKTGRVRRVVLPESARAVLDEHRRRQQELRERFGEDYRADLDLVFAQPDGEPLRPDSVSATVSALFRKLGIEKPKGGALHLLRHAHTSVLLACGVPVTAVAARLGHSSPRTTQEVYAHMIAGQDEEAARLWEAYRSARKPD